MVDGRLCTHLRRHVIQKNIIAALFQRISIGGGRSKRIGFVAGVARRDYDAADRHIFLGGRGVWGIGCLDNFQFGIASTKTFFSPPFPHSSFLATSFLLHNIIYD